jgi:hypothetical protein
MVYHGRSRGSSVRLPFAAPATLMVALAGFPASPALAQSALDQLKTMCQQGGGNCSPNVPNVPAPTRVDDGHQRAAPQAPRPKPKPALTGEQMAKVQLTGMLLEGLFSSIFDSGKNDAAAAEAAAARQQAEAALLQQRSAHVLQQRSSREAENGRSLDEMASALSDPWVGRPVEPAGADPVRIQGSGVVGLFDPPANPLARKAATPSASALASERLARLAAENADVELLASRLSDLEDRLARVRAEAVSLKRDMKGASRELDYWGEKVAEAVEEARERGISLAVDGLLTLEPKAMSRLNEVQSNSRAWNRLTGILRDSDRTVHEVVDASQTVQDRLDEAQRLLSRRDMKEDLTFLANKLGGRYAQLGGSILGSAQNIRDELAAWRGINKSTAEIAQGPARLARIKADYAALMGDVKQARLAVSQATGIPAKDLVRGAPEPVRPTSIGSVVPNPLD